MYRNRLDEIIKEKNITYKNLAEESGVSIDTINRIIRPENPEKDSPRVNTLQDLCDALGVELWEIFYLGDRSLVSLQAEINDLKAERDRLVAENAIQKAKIDGQESKIDEQRKKIDDLKDDIISLLSAQLLPQHKTRKIKKPPFRG